MKKTGLEIYFNGLRLTIPYGSVENYKMAFALAEEMTNYKSRASNGDTFYLETREQFDALFDLQRKLGVKFDRTDDDIE